MVVHEKLIAQRPAVVRELVRGIAESGLWAEYHRLDAAELVAPFFRQDPKLLKFVLTQPPDRVSYRMLTPDDADIQQIGDMAFESGQLSHPINVKELVDRSFIPAEIRSINPMAGAQ